MRYYRKLSDFDKFFLPFLICVGITLVISGIIWAFQENVAMGVMISIVGIYLQFVLILKRYVLKLPRFK